MSKIIYDERMVGTTKNSYNVLTYKPSVNKVELIGNKTSSSLSMYTKEQVDNIIANAKNVRVEIMLPRTPELLTLYYIGRQSPFHVYYCTAFAEVIDLGLSEPDTSEYLRIHNEDLDTDNKDVIPAINELHDEVYGDPTQVSIIGAGTCVKDINSIEATTGIISKLTTSDKTSITNSINELDKDIGNGDELFKDNLVDAINIIEDAKPELKTKVFVLNNVATVNANVLLPYAQMFYDGQCLPIVILNRTDGNKNIFYTCYGHPTQGVFTGQVEMYKQDCYFVSGASAGKQRVNMWITKYVYIPKSGTSTLQPYNYGSFDVKKVYDFTIQ